MWSRFVPVVVLGVFMAATLTGCSVGMALSGDENPELSVIKVGATRGEVELQLGEPIETQTAEGGGRIDTYEYEIGNEPSAGRAVAHGVADVLTLGIWELVGTPIEAVQGDKYQTKITYGPDDKVTHIDTEKVEVPETELKDAKYD